MKIAKLKEEFHFIHLNNNNNNSNRKGENSFLHFERNIAEK